MEKKKGTKIIFIFSQFAHMKEIKDLRKELQKKFKECIGVIAVISELT
jgi:hypothetical protein